MINENYNYNGKTYHSLEEVVAAYYNNYIAKDVATAEGYKIHTLQDCPVFVLDNMVIAGVLTVYKSVYSITEFGKGLLYGLLNERDVYETEMSSTIEKLANCNYERKLDELLDSGFFDKELGNGCKFSFDKGFDMCGYEIYQFTVENGMNHKHRIEYLFNLMGINDVTLTFINGTVMGTFRLGKIKYLENYIYMICHYNKMKL